VEAKAEQARKKEEERANRLESVVQEQRSAFEELRQAWAKEHSELQLLLEGTRKELQEVKRELQSLRDSVDKTTASQLGPVRSYASVAAGREIPSIIVTDSDSSSLSVPRTNRSKSSSSSDNRLSSISPDSSVSKRADRLKYPAVDLDLAGSTLAGEKPSAIRKRLEQAFDQHVSTRAIRCAGLTQNATNMEKIRVLFKTAEDADKAKQHQEWMGNFPGARITEGRGFPVKVDGVDKLTLFDRLESTRMKEDAIKIVNEEKGINAISIGWLSRDTAKPRGSAVIRFRSRNEAEAVLQKGILDFSGLTAETTDFLQTMF